MATGIAVNNPDLDPFGVSSSLEKATLPATMARIRAKLNNDTETFQDFTHNVAMELLTRLHLDAKQMRAKPIVPARERTNENKEG